MLQPQKWSWRLFGKIARTLEYEDTDPFDNFELAQERRSAGAHGYGVLDPPFTFCCSVRSV